MKKIDKLLLSSFFPPFVVTFFIALFVLIMQTLWVYIDDIIGKGAGLAMISEFMVYLSISHFIMALPIAVLISSVMVMGNLAEHYELSSMKSAGVSLLRVMRPLMVACALIGLFSWFSANYITPVANLKFKSRLYDMRKQKPTLNMEEGIFNDDFEGYKIRIGEKGADNKTIKDVFIANHIATQRDRLNEIIAKGGIMYNTPNKRFLVMELEEGQQFQEGNRYAGNGKSKAPFVRTSFKKYTKIFDMKEFDINRTDEELFRTHYSMLSIRQLQNAIDSIDKQMLDRRETTSSYINQYLNGIKPPKKDSSKIETASSTKGKSIEIKKVNHQDSLVKIATATKKEQVNKKLATKGQAITIEKSKIPVKKRKSNSNALKLKSKVAEQNIDHPLTDYESLLETFSAGKKTAYVTKAIQQARSIKSNADSAHRYLVKTGEKRIKHVFELHSKYAFATVCFVFLFIGAPMGALVRKGGFGYPLLIAIIFFMLFITLTLTFKRMAEALVVPTLLAVWLPNLIILPIGFFLTYKAMNDSKVFDAARIRSFFQQILARFQKKKTT